jgi:predicted dienelactone hydrolase
VVWYPASVESQEKDEYIGPPGRTLFYAGRMAKDASLAHVGRRFPLIAISHGSGGSALQMAWLGTSLAANGFVAVAVDHPGNNSVSGYTPQGFVLWWERARDLTTAITALLADAQFGPAIDPDRIGAAGFSLGGYTIMELAGATTDQRTFRKWCANGGNPLTCNPPEHPDAGGRTAAMAEKDPEVRASLGQQGRSFRDKRVKAVFAVAPAVAYGVTLRSLRSITIPVAIVVGNDDKLAPATIDARRYASAIAGAELTVLPGGVGHYTFLDVATEEGKKQLPQFAVDGPGVDREAVHEHVAKMAADFFQRALATKTQ